ncbi:MAG: hypothetical protein JSS72_04500 [Armatimonadetes bacterium]|nr:hypothetical protein [Armatimonadota bacterium]
MRPRSLLFFAAIASLVCGCGKSTSQQVVFVDLDQIAPRQIQLPPAKTLGAITVPGDPGITLPALPARTVKNKINGSEVDISGFLEKRKQKVLKQLTRRLSNIYQSRLASAEAEQRQAMTAKQQEISLTYRARLRSLFDQYAEKRGPIVARLAFMVGFPEPRNRGQARPETKGAVAEQRRTEIRSLRAKLAQIEKDYKQGSATLILERQNALDLPSLEFSKAVEQARIKADSEAQADAEKQVQLLLSDLQAPALKGSEIQIPAAPEARSGAIPGSTLPAVPIEGDSPQVFTKEDLRAELNIWLGINGYRLGKAGDGLDKTKEFKEWRQTHRFGP